MIQMENKVVLVTGAASGIGLATTKRFLELGAKVMMADWSDKGEEIKNSLGYEGSVLYMNTDVSKEEDVKNLIAKTIASFGRLDVAVANAGVGSYHRPHEESLEDWNRVIDINLTGVFLTGKYAVIEMLKQGTGGAIINMASILGLTGSADGFTYSVTKGGIINMTRSFALAYAKDKIRVNAIAPGYIDTAILTGMTPDMRVALEALHPIGRLGVSDEIADVVCYLASDSASFVTGITLPVDGGYTAQ